MAALVNASLWIDFTRARSPRNLKQFVAPFIQAADACLADPIVYEVLRHATEAEVRLLTEQFATLPVLLTRQQI